MASSREILRAVASWSPCGMVVVAPGASILTGLDPVGGGVEVGVLYCASAVAVIIIAAAVAIKNGLKGLLLSY